MIDALTLLYNDGPLLTIGFPYSAAHRDGDSQGNCYHAPQRDNGDGRLDYHPLLPCQGLHAIATFPLLCPQFRVAATRYVH